MPKVFRVGRMKSYGYRIFIGGEDRWFSSGTENRKEAQRIADTHKRAVKAGLTVSELFDLLISRLAEVPDKERDRIRGEFGQKLLQFQAEQLPIDGIWQAWLEKNGDQAENTLKTYKAICDRFITWAQKRRLKYLHDVGHIHAEEYASTLWKMNLTPRTYNGHIKWLKSMCVQLKRKAGLNENPFDGIKMREMRTQSRENFTLDELRLILEHVQGDWRGMTLIGLYTGLRLVDVTHLEWRAVGADVIELVPQKTKRKGKSVKVPIHAGVRSVLDDLRAGRGDSEFLFPAMVARYKRDPTSLSKEFGEMLRQVGIETTASEIEGRRARRAAVKGFHSLRHSFVSLCAEAKVPQATIQDLVGHGSPAMTRNYCPAALRAGRRAISP